MIKPGMTIIEAIAQLTKGFIKVMGRKPDGLEKIKIKQEAGQKLKDLEKVVDMEGNVIDATKPIVGGSQEASIKKNIAEATGKGDFKGIFNQLMRDSDIAKDFKKMKAEEKAYKEMIGPKKLIPDRDVIPYQSKEIQKMSPADKQKYLITNDKQTAELLKKGLTFDDIIYAQDYYGLTAKEIMQEAAGATKKDPFPFAEGGRIGFGGGSDMGTVADSQGNVGPGKGGYQGGGTGPVERPGGGGGDGPPGSEVNNPIKDIAKKVAINQLSKKLGFAKFANPIGQFLAIKGLYDSVKNPMGNPTQFGIGNLFNGDDDEDESKKESGPQNVSLGTGLAEQAKQAVIDRQAQIEEAAKALGYAQGGRIGLKEGEGIMQLASVDSPFFSPEYADDHSFEMFGKPYKELNADELEEFQEEMNRLMNKFSKVDRGAPSITLAEGGRIGYKDGPKDPGKRKFIKAAVGLASMLPLGIGKGVKVAAPVVKKAAEMSEPALAKIVETVMSAGKLISITGKRVKDMVTKKKLKNVEVEEDIADGSYIIKKDGKEIYYKPGRQDETGIDDSIIEVIEDTVTKKAGGGIARMLGE
jgi:hypothetical protein